LRVFARAFSYSSREVSRRVERVDGLVELVDLLVGGDVSDEGGVLERRGL
jgi:hypothetical protein